MSHNQRSLSGLALGKMSQNSSNETDSKMAKTGKQATTVSNKKQAAAQEGFLILFTEDWVSVRVVHGF